MTQTPLRRMVFYIPGFDPRPARRYREIYRSQGAQQAAWSGYDLALLPAQQPARAAYGWQVRSAQQGAPAHSDIEVLVWADIVKSAMPKGDIALYRQLWRTARLYFGSGAIFALVGLRKGPAIAALYPALFLCVQAIAGLGLGLWAGFWGWQSHSPLAGIGLGAAVAGAVYSGARALGKRLHVGYLMQDFAFAAQDAGAYPPQLAARMAQFSAQIAASLDQPYGEVLVVGHSSGAYMAASVMADVLRKRRAAGKARAKPALGLLTLGQVVPMVSFLPRANQLRRDLHDLSHSPDITWVDVSAPSDGCAFALCDPVAVTGVAPPQGQLWPLVISCSFRQTLSPALWRALRWRFFRLHFQYIHAFDRAGRYDYFAITAGPQTLAQRFADTPPSRQRKADARSPYRDMAP
jgi:hypothetical protein